MVWSKAMRHSCPEFDEEMKYNGIQVWPVVGGYCINIEDIGHGLNRKSIKFCPWCGAKL